MGMTAQRFHTIPTSCAILPPLTQICFLSICMMCCKMAWHKVYSICSFFFSGFSVGCCINRKKGYLLPTWVWKITLSTFRLNAPVVIRVFRLCLIIRAFHPDDDWSIQSKCQQSYFPNSSWYQITFLSVYLIIVYCSQRVTYEPDKRIWVDGRPSLNPVALNYLKRSESKLCNFFTKMKTSCSCIFCF